MAEKKKFVLRLDEDVYLAIEKWASDEFRSVNGQMEWMLSKKLQEARRIQISEKVPPLDETSEK